MDGPLIAVIGLDSPEVEILRREAPEIRFVHYPAPPETPPLPHALDGHFFMESKTKIGKLLDFDGVIYYGYFENADNIRRAIALSDIPSYPDIAPTLAHDDRAMSLALADRADVSRGAGGWHPRRRGYLSAHQSKAVTTESVHKRTFGHCGVGKYRAQPGEEIIGSPSVVEPFIEGVSKRVLLVESNNWILRYDSVDWRKNVGGTVAIDTWGPDSAGLLDRAFHIQRTLNLDVVGIDFVVPENASPVLLEVNAYPGFDDVPEAAEAFSKLAVKRLMDGWRRRP
jgi:hypothetical protein